MKQMKILTLAVLAAAGLMSLVGVSAAWASSTAFCAKNQTPCEAANIHPAGTKFHAELEAGTKMVIQGALISTQCSKATMDGHTEQATSNPLGITLTTFKIEECSNGCQVNVVNPGTLDVTYTPGTMNGTVTKTKTEVTVQCLGIHCVFTGDHLGTLTGGANNGMATIDQNSVTTKTAGPFLCGDTATTTALWTVTSPDPLWVAA